VKDWFQFIATSIILNKLIVISLKQNLKNEKMKQLITILTLLLCFNSLGQQIDINEEVKKDFTAYFNLIGEGQIENSLEYINPKLFEIIPREQMRNLMEAVYKMPNIEYKVGIPKFLKFEELKIIENSNYVKFFIISPIEMKFKDIKNSKEKILEMTKNFETKFGVGNVKFDKQSGFYKINAEKIIIANSNNNLLDWKFVTVDNPKMKVLLEKIIPSELLN
jgi:hypothetical protein